MKMQTARVAGVRVGVDPGYGTVWIEPDHKQTELEAHEARRVASLLLAAAARTQRKETRV